MSINPAKVRAHGIWGVLINVGATIIGRASLPTALPLFWA